MYKSMSRHYRLLDKPPLITCLSPKGLKIVSNSFHADFNPLKPNFFKTEPPSRKYNTLLRLDHYYNFKFDFFFFFFLK